MRTKPYATSILVFDEVELLDVTGPASLLTAAGRQWNFQPFKLELVAVELGAVTTRSNVALQATRSLADSNEVECLIIPGGYGARRAAQDDAVVDWVRRTAARAQFVLLVGNGVWVAARAGLLDGADIAVAPEMLSELQTACPAARCDAHSGVCTSGKLFSASKSALGLDLACELVARTLGKKLASALSSSLGVSWVGELEVVEIVSGLPTSK